MTLYNILEYILKHRTKDDAYSAGYRCGLYDPSELNCDFRLFRAPELTKAWERGYAAGMKEKQK